MKISIVSPRRATEEMGRTLHMTELSQVLELEVFLDVTLDAIWR